MLHSSSDANLVQEITTWCKAKKSPLYQTLLLCKYCGRGHGLVGTLPQTSLLTWHTHLSGQCCKAGICDQSPSGIMISARNKGRGRRAECVVATVGDNPEIRQITGR